MRVNRLKYVAAFISITVASAPGVYAQNPTKADVEAEMARLSAMEVQAVECGRNGVLARESIGDSVAILDARIKAGMITGASAPIRVAPKIPESCGSEADQIAQGDAAFAVWETLNISKAYVAYSGALPWASRFAIAPDGWFQQASELEAQYRANFAKVMPPEELAKQNDAFLRTAQFDLVVECLRRKRSDCPPLTGLSSEDRQLSEIRFDQFKLFPYAGVASLLTEKLSIQEREQVNTPAYGFEGKGSDKRDDELLSGSHDCRSHGRFLIFPLSRQGARPPLRGQRQNLPLYDSHYKKVGTVLVESVDTFRYKLISSQIDASTLDEYNRPKLEGGSDFLLCLETAK